MRRARSSPAACGGSACCSTRTKTILAERPNSPGSRRGLRSWVGPMAATCGAGTFRSTPKTACRQELHVLRLPALSFSPPSCSLNSIKQSHFLMVRYVSALVNVRMVTANSQRNHGRNGGDCEDDGQCCDEGLHGWSPWYSASVPFRTTSFVATPRVMSGNQVTRARCY